jgi:hypothetical protein
MQADTARAWSFAPIAAREIEMEIAALVVISSVTLWIAGEINGRF